MAAAAAECVECLVAEEERRWAECRPTDCSAKPWRCALASVAVAYAVVSVAEAADAVVEEDVVAAGEGVCGRAGQTTFTRESCAATAIDSATMLFAVNSDVAAPTSHCSPTL